MTWFKVDDNFTDHPKTEDLPDAAVAMWTRGGSWSARHLTDGFIPERKARKLCEDPDRALKALLDAGLWESAPDGYRFHDWDDYQPTREEEMASRSARSVGGAVGNHRRWHVEKGKIDPRCQYCRGSSDRVADRSTDRSTDRVADRSTDRGSESHAIPPDPSRPDPTPLSSKSKTVGEDLDLSLTKEDHFDAQIEPETEQRPKWRNVFCPEHGGGMVTNCAECVTDHRDCAYWTKRPWTDEIKARAKELNARWAK